MTYGEIMLDAVRNSFPVVDKLCQASAEECANLLQTFEILPEKAVRRMVEDGRIRVDEDVECTQDGLSVIVVGPESDLLSRKGTMRIAIKGQLFGERGDNSLHIYCDNSPRVGAEFEVLHYSTLCTGEGLGTKFRHRDVYLAISKNGELSVRDSVTDDARIRNYSRSEYRNSHESE